MRQYVRSLDVQPTLPTSPVAAVVLLGDLFALLGFIAWGLYTHNVRAWVVPGHTLTTLTPFLVAWLALAPLAGLYQRRTLRSYGQTLTCLIPAWLGIAVGGSLIRATPLFPGGASPVFVVVNAVFGLVVLVPWRLGVVTVLNRLFPA